MTNFGNVNIIHIYRGKEVTKAFFKENRHLFGEPDPLALRSALDILGGMAHTGRKYPLFIDENGTVSLHRPI